MKKPEDLQTEKAALQPWSKTTLGVEENIPGKHGFSQFLLDEALVPIIIVSLDHATVLFANRFTREFLEMTDNDIVGMDIKRIWSEPEKREQYVQEAGKTGGVQDFEALLVTAKGNTKHVLLSAKTLMFAGHPALYSVIKDITRLKEAEAALITSEARYHDLYRLLKLMADTMPDMLWAKDMENRYIFANRAIREKLLHCSVTETPIGKNDLFFASRERTAGHQHTFGEICVNSDEVVKSSHQAGIFREDGLIRGKYLVLDVHKAPLFDDDGSLIGTVGAGRDVTVEVANQKALEESEKRYRLLAENIRDVIWVADAAFTPVYITPSVLAMSGYKQEEFLDMPVENHLTKQYRKKYLSLRRIIDRAIDNGEKIPDGAFTCECVRKNGTKYWTEMITTPMYSDIGGLQGFTGVIRDISKRVQEQKELDDARQAAMVASQTKSEFLANMSHELRTPMNGVLGALQLLKNTLLDETQQKYVDTGVIAGTSLLSLINDVLDFSKIEAGKVQLVEMQLDIRELVETVVDSFSAILPKAVEMSVAVDDAVPAQLRLDASRLKQILYNLIGNAVKFTEKGDITISLNLVKSLGTRKIIQFTITDTGIGIGEKTVERLFEPFVQEDGSYRRKYGGTGLGLSIVKKLVQLMGGEILLRSRVGEGTTVSFKVVAGIAEQPAEIIDAVPVPSIKNLPPLRLLVVEDEKINAMVISAMLGKLGHQVILAEDGREALQKVAKERFDAILMDIQMPEMDGVETTRIIRANTKKDTGRRIPIIALTAHAMKGDKEKFLQAGMDDYLAKPIDLPQLMTVLRRLIP